MTKVIETTSPHILEAVRGAVARGSASVEALANAIANIGRDGRVPSALDRALAERIAEFAPRCASVGPWCARESAYASA